MACETNRGIAVSTKEARASSASRVMFLNKYLGGKKGKRETDFATAWTLNPLTFVRIRKYRHKYLLSNITVDQYYCGYFAFDSKAKTKTALVLSDDRTIQRAFLFGKKLNSLNRYMDLIAEPKCTMQPGSRAQPLFQSLSGFKGSGSIK